MYPLERGYRVDRDALYIHCEDDWVRLMRQIRTIMALPWPRGVDHGGYQWALAAERRWWAMPEYVFYRLLLGRDSSHFRLLDFGAPWSHMYGRTGLQMRGLYIFEGDWDRERLRSRFKRDCVKFERIEKTRIVWDKDAPGQGAFVPVGTPGSHAFPLYPLNERLAPKFRNPMCPFETFEIVYIRLLSSWEKRYPRKLDEVAASAAGEGIWHQALEADSRQFRPRGRGHVSPPPQERWKYYWYLYLSIAGACGPSRNQRKTTTFCPSLPPTLQTVVPRRRARRAEAVWINFKICN
ncbi:hypothetical protein QBC39DRAFT_148531 [Podospora conica]|nr:hypothetical protein QBC39DRAFT_148531 [Schizothecium conicum]